MSTTRIVSRLMVRMEKPTMSYSKGNNRKLYGRSQDPRWIIARYNSVGACGHAIRQGEKIFYYPPSRGTMSSALCPKCGETAHREFLSLKGDEDGIPFAS